MDGLAISNKTINKYFRYLQKLDVNSKKRLILKLSESIEAEAHNTSDLKSMFGAWEDSRNADQIIQEINNSRIPSKDIEQLEKS